MRIGFDRGRVAAALLLIATLCGCGGGGASNPSPSPSPSPQNPPTAPTLIASADIKQLKFTWASATGATNYRLLQNPDGASGFTQVGADIAATVTSANVDVAVHRHDWVKALYRLEACNAAGCSASSALSVTSVMLDAIGYIKASNTGIADNFGRSIAISGDGTTLAVGASGERSGATGVNGDQTDDNVRDAGAVYLFVRVGAQWSQQAYLKASNASALDFFGENLALSADGNTLAVAAPGEDSKATGVNQDEANDDAQKAGAVYVFTRVGAQWSQQAYVKASNAQEGDSFGDAMAISADGNTLAVGATGEDSASSEVNVGQFNNAADQSGAVYVFARTGTQWVQQAYVKASNTGVLDAFGGALALSADGNLLAAGAPNEASNAKGVGQDQHNDLATSAGAVYILARAGAQWSHQAYLKASNTAAGNVFGVSVAFSANADTLAVGSPQERSAATGVDGSEVDSGVGSAGAVYVFVRTGTLGTLWVQQAYVKASNTGADDHFGSAVALSNDGNSLAVAAFGEDSGDAGVGSREDDNSASSAGAAYTFARVGTQWSQERYVKASNTGAGDFYGASLALSADGSTLAVGADHEDSHATGAGGDADDNSAMDAGAAYIY